VDLELLKSNLSLNNQAYKIGYVQGYTDSFDLQRFVMPV